MRLPVFASAITLIHVVSGCIGKPACTDDGSNALGIAEPRLSEVKGIRVSGVCTVDRVPTACGADSECYEDAKGEMVALIRVRSDKRGPCTLTVDFNDGCASRVFHLEFGGTGYNCCEDVCATRVPMDAIPATCAAD